MQAMSSSTVAVQAVETQQMRVVAPAGVSAHAYGSGERQLTGSQAQVRLRLRIAFSQAGENVTDQVDFSSFPAGLTGGRA